MQLNQILLILHFIGLTLGLSVSFANIAMQMVMAQSGPADKAVLARFPPVISRFGKAGLGLLWVTGLTLLFTKWGGFGILPWTFHVKLTLALALVAVIFAVLTFD
jgi:hypothetical protein